MILNTIESADLLIDAYKFYSRGDARAHDALRIVIDRNDMQAAVLSCLEKAKKEEEPNKQHLYVQAACLGKKFHPGIAVEEFQQTCRLLRVVNICRSYNLENIDDLESVVDQLLKKGKFDLPLWFVRWLKADGEKKILSKWSEHLIEKRYLLDDEIASKILDTLGQNPVVPYVDIANKAIEHNRIRLAIKLIENEGQSSKKIPLLLSLKQYDLVIAQALETCDSNLIFMAIFKLKESIPSEIQFLELLKKHQQAFRYYCNFLTVSDIPKLIMMSYHDGSKDELPLYLMDNRFESALTVSKRTKQDFVSHQIDIRMRLGKFHQGLKHIPHPPLTKQQQCTWASLSISETIINLVALGQTNKAKDCQKKFDVTDKKYRVLEQIAMKTLPILTVATNPNQ